MAVSGLRCVGISHYPLATLALAFAFAFALTLVLALAFANGIKLLALSVFCVLLSIPVVPLLLGIAFFKICRCRAPSFALTHRVES